MTPHSRHCQGFSNLGLRSGYEHHQSGLFRHIVRLVHTLRPRMLFLENVPGILRRGMDPLVEQLGVTEGYTLRWCVLGAGDLGAPHARRRWFCLGLVEGRESVPAGPRSVPLPRWCDPPPPRMKLTDGREDRRRARLLGNAVVPVAACEAYHALTHPGNEVSTRPVHGWPKRGAWTPTGSGPHKLRLPTLIGALTPGGVDWSLCFDPQLFRSTRAIGQRRRLPELTHPVRARRFATPRRGPVHTSNVLTRRTVHDLPTQVRFERATPESLRRGHLSATFVEWLMGFPPGWTDVCPHGTPDRRNHPKLT